MQPSSTERPRSLTRRPFIVIDPNTRWFYIGAGIVLVAIVVLGLMTGTVKTYTDVAMTSAYVGRSTAPATFIREQAEIACRAPNQNDLTAYVRVERSGPFWGNQANAFVEVLVSTNDGGTLSVERYRRPLVFDNRTRQRDYHIVVITAVPIRLPAQMQGRPLTWQASARFPSDANVANNSMSGSLPVC